MLEDSWTTKVCDPDRGCPIKLNLADEDNRVPVNATATLYHLVIA